MQQKYYVSHETKQLGPYSVDEIVNFVSDGTLSPLDYIYDEGKGDWMVFLEHHVLAEKVKSLKPKAPPRQQEPVHETTKAKKSEMKIEGKKVPANLKDTLMHEWFVLKGENKFGPFSYTDVVKMLQQGVVYEFDFAWHEGLPGWNRIAEINDFDKEHLKDLRESSMPELNEVFFRRRYRRVKYGGTLIIHDNKSVWKGHALEVSEGGAGVVMENAMIIPGQELYLHFKPGDGVPPFSAHCEVVSKEFTKDLPGRNSPVKYGLKFKSVSTETLKALKDYTKKVA